MPTSKLTLTSEVKYLKGVGPARAEILASRGIFTVEDLLSRHLSFFASGPFQAIVIALAAVGFR